MRLSLEDGAKGGGEGDCSVAWGGSAGGEEGRGGRRKVMGVGLMKFSLMSDGRAIRVLLNRNPACREFRLHAGRAREGVGEKKKGIRNERGERTRSWRSLVGGGGREAARARASLRPRCVVQFLVTVPISVGNRSSRPRPLYIILCPPFQSAALCCPSQPSMQAHCPSQPRSPSVPRPLNLSRPRLPARRDSYVVYKYGKIQVGKYVPPAARTLAA